MNPNRVADLLASGLKPSQVATIIGVTPARISQLLTDTEFKLLLDGKIVEVEQRDVEEINLSAKYSAAEHALVNQVMEMAPTSELRDVTAALRVVAERQERMKTRILSPTNNGGNTINNTIIALSLPSHALANPPMEITKTGEVISIGDRTLAPLSSTAVTNLFSRMSQSKTELVETETIEQEKGEYHDPKASNRSPEASSGEVIRKEFAESFLSYAGR